MMTITEPPIQPQRKRADEKARTIASYQEKITSITEPTRHLQREEAIEKKIGITTEPSRQRQRKRTIKKKIACASEQ